MSDPFSISKPLWASLQLAERAWLDDLYPWIPTSNALYATLIGHGYSRTPQGRVVIYSTDHAKAVFHRFYQVCTFDAPSPVAPALCSQPLKLLKLLRRLPHRTEACVMERPLPLRQQPQLLPLSRLKSSEI
eukprot:6185897-Pleurochrysis_carterae.AAC.2